MVVSITPDEHAVINKLNKKSFSSENQVVILLLKMIRQQLSKRLSRKIDNVKKYEQGEGERIIKD